MINRDTPRDAARATARTIRVPADAACVHCGENDPRVLESHHVAGRRNDSELTVWLCRNHHEMLTDELRAGGVRMTAPSHPIEWLIATLGGLAEFLRLLATRLKGWATWLTLMMSSLDEHAPAWRERTLTLPSPFVLAPVLS